MDAPVQETTGTPPADGEKSTLERADAGTGVVHPPPQPGKRGSTATPRQPSRAGTDATTAATAAAAGPSTVIKRMTTGLLTPDKPIRVVPGYRRSWINIARSSWLNLLLVFIPISWALHFTVEAKNPTAVFITCFIAVIPLAALLGYTTEQLTLYTSQTIGGLLNATLGNVVELIVGIIALIKCELQVVQSSLVGSILSNLLLVCGMCFLLGGSVYSEQQFAQTAAQLNSSLLLFSVIAVLIPSAFHFSIKTTSDGAGTSITTAEEKADILALSHGVAIILLLIYLGYLLFQFFTHADLFADRKGPTGSTRYPEQVTRAPGELARKTAQKIRRRRRRGPTPGTTSGGGGDDLESFGEDSTSTYHLPESEQPQLVGGGIGHAIAHIHGTSSALQRNGEGMMVNRKGQVVRASTAAVGNGEDGEEQEEEEEQEPELNWQSAILCMILISAIVGVTAEFLVGSINGLVETHPSLSQEWVGLILLPIIGNAAEHLTALVTAYKDKVDLALAVAVGSSIQIALFVIPVIVIIGWIIGKPLLMLFDPFESVVLFLSVIIVNQTLSDGKSNWMEGFLLFMVYIMVAVVFWYYPGSETANLIGQPGCS